MHAAKNVMCQMKIKQTAIPLYLQKICTDGNGLMIPIQNEMISVSEVIVIETAASDIVIPMRSGTLNFTDVRRKAANITNVSSIPIPVRSKEFRFREGWFIYRIQCQLTNQQKRCCQIQTNKFNSQVHAKTKCS